MKLLPLFLLLIVFSATAEKADRDKPTEVEANRMSADDVRRMNIFEGNVVLTKGTMRVQAEREQAGRRHSHRARTSMSHSSRTAPRPAGASAT